LAPHDIEKYLVSELVKDSSNEQIVKKYLSKLSKKQILQLLEKYLDEQAEDELQVPLSILSNRKLSCLELIIRFLRENAGLSNAETAQKLGRSQQVCWTTYKNAVKKNGGDLQFELSEYDIPLKLFRGKLSVLETIVAYLVGRGLSFHEIAQRLSRDDRTIWTAYRRALKK